MKLYGSICLAQNKFFDLLFNHCFDINHKLKLKTISINIKSYIYLSPIFNEIEPSELVDFLKDLHNKGINTDKIRVQIQLHKIIWDPMKRGV